MKPILSILIALTAVAAVPAAEGGDRHDQKPAATAVEHATVVGTITALDPGRKSITLKDDATGESDEYRPFYRGGHADEIAKKLAELKVGARIAIVYTENEGRRVISFEPAKSGEHKDAK